MPSHQRAVGHGAPRPGRSRLRSRTIAAVAALLAVSGIALLAVGCAASRPGPPSPSPAAAGTIPPASEHSAAPPPALSPTSPPVDLSASEAPSVVTDAPADSEATSTVSPQPKTPPVASAPHSTRAPATSRPAATTGAAPHPGPATSGPVLAPSRPVRLQVPAIGVDTSLLKLGLNPDGTVQVPPLDDPDSKAGWYQNSPTPGTVGPAVILGHIDSAKYGPGVFYHLGQLRPGDHADVTLADGTVAVFRIDAVRSYPKDAFPTLTVYGNIDYAGLRLITCGGAFDYSERSYENNIVAYASLVSSHRG